MFAIQVMWTYVQGFAKEQAARVPNERGASAVEWAIIVAGAATIALVVIEIIRRTATSKANSIPTE